MSDQHDSPPQQSTVAATTRFQPLLDFGMKISNDWIFQLSSLLAYSFLTSLFPLLLVVVAIAGLVIGTISPASLAAFEASISAALPAGIGTSFIDAVIHDVHTHAGPILIIGVLTALFGGSRLFVAIENCAGVIFRLRGRAPIPQNLIALGMTLLYVVLIPIIIGAGALPGIILNVLGFSPRQGVSGVLVQGVGVVIGVGAAILLFGTIYTIVPNRPVALKDVWQGACAAGGLLVLYELLFPFYATTLLRSGGGGALAGFAIVILAFFYYLSFILLLGMEINSWVAGQRQTAGDIQTILHAVQVHNTTRGAAGPTAGTSAEHVAHPQDPPVVAHGPAAMGHERSVPPSALPPI